VKFTNAALRDEVVQSQRLCEIFAHKLAQSADEGIVVRSGQSEKLGDNGGNEGPDYWARQRRIGLAFLVEPVRKLTEPSSLIDHMVLRKLRQFRPNEPEEVRLHGICEIGPFRMAFLLGKPDGVPCRDRVESSIHLNELPT